MLNILVAPSSYNADAEKITKSIVKFLKAEQKDYSVFFSQSVDDMTKNMQQLFEDGETDFVVVGDDFVLHKIINSTKDLSKIKLGIVPIGKNDDFANYLGISQNPINAIKQILSGGVEKIDYLMLNDMKVINNIVLGASVEKQEIFSSFKIKNLLTEKIAELKTAKNFSGVSLTLEMKQKQKDNFFEMIIANAGMSKGKMISPLSNLKDGLFNLCYSTLNNKAEKQKFLSNLKQGKHIYNDNTKQFWLTNLKITGETENIKALADGELFQDHSFEISIVEGGLNIMKG